VDSIFMMPQLGVLSTISEQAATEVFYRDCLIPLGPCIAPAGSGRAGSRCATLTMDGPTGRERVEVKVGEMRLLPLAEGERARVTVDPARGFDAGDGPGREVESDVTGGVVGLIVDARGRPLELPEDDEERMDAIRRWERALDAYPELPGEVTRE
jgi:hypothetical protein